MAGKNIVLLSDGTGNSSAKLFRTNVWRTYQALDLSDPTAQVAYYDDGVGTSSFKPLAILGGVFGVGLKRNVIDIYSFCCRNYQPGDRIYGFGFSRGAFTIRIVAGFIARIGLVHYDGNDANLARDAEIAYRQYRKERNYRTAIHVLVGSLRALRDRVSQTIWRKPSFKDLKRTDVARIDFLGVWDTVDAYGGPIEEITRAIDIWYWPLSMPDQFMSHKISRACHALALEEERDAFRPVLWDDRYVRKGERLYPVEQGWAPAPLPADRPLAEIDRERISQVWFVGVHSDIGGGYSRDGLSYRTLAWMMERAEVYGLKYIEVQENWLRSFINPYDKLNDSRHGLSGYYRYRPRKLDDVYSKPPYKLKFAEDLRHIRNILANRPDPEHEVRADLAAPEMYRLRPAPKIHHSVFDRVAVGTDGYSPIVLPETYCVVGADGSVALDSGPRAAQAHARVIRQEAVWDWVWARRVAYFATVAASLYLAAMPLIQMGWPGRGPASPAEVIVPLLDLVAGMLPGFISPWLDAFRAAPGRFLIGVLVVALLLSIGGSMQRRIRDLMRSIWHNPSTAPPPAPSGAIYRLRTAGAYRAFFYLLKHWVLPAVFALAIAVVLFFAAFTLLNRSVFLALDLGGGICTASPAPQPVAVAPQVRPFATSALCAATGLAVARDKRYQVVLEVTEPWIDGTIATDPQGFGRDKMSAPMWLGLPLRRLLASNWFTPVLRIRPTGLGEIVPNWERQDSPPCNCPATTRYVARFKAQRNGELFVYVNDAVLAWPGAVDYFYVGSKGLNHGKANLTVSQIAD
ncbi:MAG TPA: DUF2235 domain-containing protein [Tardiphaga sp.]